MSLGGATGVGATMAGPVEQPLSHAMLAHELLPRWNLALMRSSSDGLQESLLLQPEKSEHLGLQAGAQVAVHGAGAQATGAGAQATGAGAQATGFGAQGAGAQAGAQLGAGAQQLDLWQCMRAFSLLKKPVLAPQPVSQLGAASQPPQPTALAMTGAGAATGAGAGSAPRHAAPSRKNVAFTGGTSETLGWVMVGRAATAAGRTGASRAEDSKVIIDPKPPACGARLQNCAPVLSISRAVPPRAMPAPDGRIARLETVVPVLADMTRIACHRPPANGTSSRKISPACSASPPPRSYPS